MQNCSLYTTKAYLLFKAVLLKNCTSTNSTSNFVKLLLAILNIFYLTTFFFLLRKRGNKSEDFDEEFTEEEIVLELEDFLNNFHRRIYSLLDRSEPNSFSKTITNLENKFYVSDKNKSLYEYLKENPKCGKERNFPLRRRIGTFDY